MSPSTLEFLFAQSELQLQMEQAAAVQRQAALWQQKRLWHVLRACTTPVAQGGTERQTEAHVGGAASRCGLPAIPR